MSTPNVFQAAIWRAHVKQRAAVMRLAIVATGHSRFNDDEERRREVDRWAKERKFK